MIKQRDTWSNPYNLHSRQDGMQTGRQNWSDVSNIPPRIKPEITIREAAFMVAWALVVICAVNGFARFVVAIADWIGRL